MAGANGYTDKEAAAAIGTRYGAFLHWLHGRYVPGYFTLVAVLRQIRDGRDPLVDASLKPAEFAAMLTSWRAEHGFTQRQAAIAIGCEFAALQSWEQQEHVPQQPGLAEIIRRLRMPVDAERVKAATRIKRPIEPEAFAARLREWRKRHRLSQAQAGRVLGTTARTIWVWEKARSLPNRPLAVLAKLDAQPVGATEVHGWLKRTAQQRDPRGGFGKKLHAWRKANGLNQLEACRVLGLPLDQALISKWEKRKALPRPKRLKAILAVIAGGAR